MKILLIGANGQLGTDFEKIFQKRGLEVISVRHVDLEICDFPQVSSAIGSIRPDVVVNTAAFHKVEECEKDLQRSFSINALAVGNLARCCDLCGVLLIQFSTDYVFDGRKLAPYGEFDYSHPLNIYGASKLAGEHLIRIGTERYLIVRTSGLFGVAGSSGKGGNFIEMMLARARRGEQIRVVTDQVLTPTYTVDLAEKVMQLIEARTCGLYHISGEGETSWYDFTRAIFEYENMEVNVVPVLSTEFPKTVVRPAYSVLSKERLYSLGLSKMPHWRDALDRYLKERHRLTVC